MVGVVKEGGTKRIDGLARELSRVTTILEHFLTDVERGKDVPESVRIAATMARFELDGQSIAR